MKTRIAALAAAGALLFSSWANATTPTQTVDYELALPDGAKLFVELPGSFDFATEERTGTIVPYYSPGQAAQIGLELAILNRPNYIPRALTGMRAGPGDLQGGDRGSYRLCLYVGRANVRNVDPPREVRATVTIEIPGQPRHAIRKSDGRRVLMFTVSQAEKVFSELLNEGFTIPEAAIAVAGFAASSSSGSGSEPLTPGCGECRTGVRCEGQRSCCSGEGGTCQSCRLCAADFDAKVTLTEDEP